MDDRQLEALFRDAASTAPPASFDEQDVIAGSRRVTARRRVAFAGGSVAAAAVLVGGIGVGTGGFTGGDTTAQSAPPPSVSTLRSAEKPPTVLGLPQARSECGPPDQALARALAGQLPDVGPSSPVPAMGCAPGSRSAAYVIQGGRVSAVLSPVGTVPPDQMRPGETQRPDGTRQFMAKAHSGRILFVSSQPSGTAAPPHADQLRAIAEKLADRF